MVMETLFDSDREAFSQRAAALADWWQGPCGRYLATEQARLLEQLDCFGGYHQLQLSSFGHRFAPLAGQRSSETPGHPFSLHPCRLAATVAEPAAALADFAELPLPSGVIDQLVLHHTLEYSRGPREVLAEGARVVADGGQLTLILFNPFSPWGGLAPLFGRLDRLGRYHPQPVARFHRLRAARVVDWLALLQLQVASVRYAAYNPPLPWQWAQRSDRDWQLRLGHCGVPLASCTVIHAVKRSGARLTSRPAKWRAPLALPAARSAKSSHPSSAQRPAQSQRFNSNDRESSNE